MRVLAVSLLVVATSCRTRPYKLPDEADLADLAPPSDLAALPDLARSDLVPPDDCPPEAKLVYVIDAHTRMLSSFRPDTLTFSDVKILDCPAHAGFSPGSMAVQRDGTAWVAYVNRLFTQVEIFRVDIKTGACDPASHTVSPGAPIRFGMAIALDSGIETLYIAGSVGVTSSNDQLGTLDLSTFAFSPRGAIDGVGDLTSDAAGHLYTFLPDWFGAQARVEDLDKLTGAALQTWPLPSIDSYMGDVAVAAWGGELWLFAGMGPADGTTTVLRLDPSTGNLTPVIPDTGRHVVGAGVAPCK